ncbi:uncharacterized protein LOC127081589 [Lathyrus oleraceus]|uniref:uncharacterized protein LOC127081589 n=1 Tax=Pisum sativum TaxID=3888 RepID=UPI0021CF5081|nr:uncharacterized protein LOC127081589 [Pisum sativum]
MSNALQAQQNPPVDAFHDLGKFQMSNSLTFKGRYDLDDWWDNARPRLEVVGAEITWTMFRAAFLEKYFPTDVCSKKEIEFLKMKQGRMIVVEYAMKFEELVKFCPHYHNVVVEESKCVKFESGLRLEIKGISYQEICKFPTLVKKYKIYDENNKAKSAHYKSLSERRGKNQNRGKSYSAPADKGKQKDSDDKKPSE